MKRVLLAGLVATGLVASGVALAADLPSRRYAPIGPAAAYPIFTWTGFYIGANAGGAFGSDHSFFVPGVGFVGNSGHAGGFTGGAQAGYNYQIGAVVIGAETDIQYANLRSNPFNGAVLVPGFAPFIERGIDWFGTVRGRVGYAFDRTLVYGTAGFAYGGGGGNGCAAFGAPAVVGCSSDLTRTGSVFGGGVEYAFTNNLTGKVEGLWVNLDRSNTFAGTLNGFPVFATGNRTEDFGVIRAGLNYKFW